jgi:hypothetical protein
MFLLEMDDDVEGETADDLGISLHTLTGIDVSNTMTLNIFIHDASLVALVNMGSTHTFIQEAAAT